jgi:hypothetical protein
MSTEGMLKPNNKQRSKTPADLEAEKMWGKEKIIKEDTIPILTSKYSPYGYIVVALHSFGSGTLDKIPRWEIGFHLLSRNEKFIYSEGQYEIAPKSVLSQSDAVSVINTVTLWLKEPRSRQDVEIYIGMVKTALSGGNFNISTQWNWLQKHPIAKNNLEVVSQTVKLRSR